MAISNRHPYFWHALIITTTISLCITTPVAFLCRNGTVSWCNYLRIQKGMSLEKVERILGPGQACSDTVNGQEENWYEWVLSEQEGSIIYIGFEEGRVVCKDLHSNSFFREQLRFGSFSR